MLRQQANNARIMFTDDGYEICTTVPGRYLTDAKRYINPKMEKELAIFKKKITMRFSNKEISDNYVFPRVEMEPSNQTFHPPSPKRRSNLLHQQATRSHSLEAQTTNSNPLKSSLD